MKTKLAIFTFLVVIFSGFGFTLKNSDLDNKSMTGWEPDQFDIYVDIYNIPSGIEEATVFVYGYDGDWELWAQSNVEINGAGYGSFHMLQETFTGTILVKVSYYYATCEYWGSDTQNGWFHWGGGPYYFETTSYIIGNCN